MNLKKILVIIVPFLALSCRTESIKDNGYPLLTIASDYLYPTDTILFKDIADSVHCKLQIRHMNADQLIGEIRNNRFNSGIDLIMMESPFDVNRINRLNIFHPLRSSEIRNRWKDYNVVPIAIDPYIIISKEDSLQHIVDSTGFKKTLLMFQEQDLIVYLSYDYLNTDPIVAAGKIREERHKYTYNRTQTWQVHEIITGKSEIHQFEKDSLYRNFKWSNKSETGRYNVYTIGILNQPEHYQKAINFIRLFRQNSFLRPFLNKLNLEEITIHHGSSKLVLEDQIQYFTQIERALR